MHGQSDRNVVALHAQLTAALKLADELDLTIVAIHLDEARTALARATRDDRASHHTPTQPINH